MAAAGPKRHGDVCVSGQSTTARLPVEHRPMSVPQMTHAVEKKYDAELLNGNKILRINIKTKEMSHGLPKTAEG